MGGLSLVVFLVFRWTALSDYSHLVFGAGVIGLLLNWPHFAATNFRLYGSRANIAQYPITAVSAPLICSVAVGAALVSPLLVAPVFFKVFLIWSPFHYSGQTLGVSMLYARRAAFRVSAITRSAMAAFIYLTYISQTAAAETSPTGSLYFGVRVPSFGLPTTVPSLLRVTMYICGGLALLTIAATSITRRRFAPLALVLVPFSQYVWFVLGSDIPGFRETVPAFHSLQYLLVAWAMRSGSANNHSSANFRPALKMFSKWMGFNLFGGAVLFYLLPRVPGRLGYVSPMLAAGVVTAGVQMHHFFVDGVIWKLRSRAVAAPLQAEEASLLPSDSLEGKELAA